MEKSALLSLRINQLALQAAKEKTALIPYCAGRGNPNCPKEAFFTLGQFAVEETRRVSNEKVLAGMPDKRGIAERLMAYIEKHSNEPGVELLKNIVNHGITKEGFNPDNWVFELVDGIIGIITLYQTGCLYILKKLFLRILSKKCAIINLLLVNLMIISDDVYLY